MPSRTCPMPAGHVKVNPRPVPPTNFSFNRASAIIIGHICLPKSPGSARAQYVHSRRSEVVVKHVVRPTNEASADLAAVKHDMTTLRRREALRYHAHQPDLVRFIVETDILLFPKSLKRRERSKTTRHPVLGSEASDSHHVDPPGHLRSGSASVALESD